jgi:hypothetical protein
MVYVSTFGSFLGHMLVNVPYMEHMGINIIITMDSIIILSQWLFNGMFEYAKDGGQSLNPGN